jgi:hypothetical protein
MDYLGTKDTRVNLLGNDLVLIARKDNAINVSLQPDLDLEPALAGGRLATCNEAVIPPAEKTIG